MLKSGLVICAGDGFLMARALNILLVEDNDDDVSLVQRATRQIQRGHQVVAVPDGRAAVSWLQSGGEHAGGHHSPFPDLILVDLALPGMSGFEFLEWLRHQPQFRTIPSIVLTGSSQIGDVKQAYLLGARGYLMKPVEFEDLLKQLRALYGFWSSCEFPRRPAPGETGINPS